MPIHANWPFRKSNALQFESASPATRLLEKRRQMFEVQELLEQQKQEFAQKVCAWADMARVLTRTA